eukprot:589026-Amphidinium_carterae.1
MKAFKKEGKMVKEQLLCAATCLGAKASFEFVVGGCNQKRDFIYAWSQPRSACCPRIPSFVGLR